MLTILLLSLILIVNPVVGGRKAKVSTEDDILLGVYEFIHNWLRIPNRPNRLTEEEFFKFVDDKGKTIIQEYYLSNHEAFINRDNIDLELFKTFIKKICEKLSAQFNVTILPSKYTNDIVAEIEEERQRREAQIWVRREAQHANLTLGRPGDDDIL